MFNRGRLFSVADCNRVSSELRCRKWRVCLRLVKRPVELLCAGDVLTATLTERSQDAVIDPSSSVNLPMMNGWWCLDGPSLHSVCQRKTYPPAISMLMSRRRARCRCRSCSTSAKGGRSRLSATLFNRMMVGAGRGAVMIPALSGWWGGSSSSAPLTASALVRHEALAWRWCETADTPYSTCGNFSGLTSKRGVTFTLNSIYAQRRWSNGTSLIWDFWLVKSFSSLWLPTGWNSLNEMTYREDNAGLIPTDVNAHERHSKNSETLEQVLIIKPPIHTE